MDTPPPSNTPRITDERWKFLRDLGVFQFKLALNNLHNFVQIPVTLAIAIVDLVFKGESEGARFYKFLEFGRGIDDAIDIYSVIGHRERSLNREFTVDAVVKKLEDVIVREYEKGGTAATVKSALDKAIDEMQAKANAGKERAADAVKTAAEKLREKMEPKS